MARIYKRARRPLLSLLRAEELETRRLLAFGLTTTNSLFTVDTGAGVVFSVIKGGTLTSTIHLGDITSVKYNGTELLSAYSVTSRYSHYETGLGSTTVVTATIDPSPTPQWIKITCDDSASGGVIQTYVAKNGETNIYMATLPTNGSFGLGEGRIIMYMSRSVFTNIEAPSNLTGNTGAIEGSDVYGFADGTTASKFYNMGRRIIDHVYHGITGTNVGAFMFMGNREHSAGGPFFKDIDFQTTSATTTEMYNYEFSGHTQTETFRNGLQGPFAMQITDGSTPVAPDYSFLEGVGIAGLVPTTGRGSLSGTASGMVSGHQTTIGLSSTAAQYWVYADAATGAFTISGVQPGTYTMTMYDQELAVGTRTITIAAQANTAADIINTYVIPVATWRIGTWDGTPAGFLNSDKISIMHPSDSRMTNWASTPNFVIGTNTDSEWPLAQFKSGVGSERITFTLTAAEAAQAQTLRIGITLGFAGGRDQIVVNSGQSFAWTSSIPAASTNLNSRGITRGTWRGPNQLYTYNIPVSALQAGVNTIDLNVVSGSSGTKFLSPNVVYDAIDLVPTATLTNTPHVASISVTASNSSLFVGEQLTFVAAALDQFGNSIATNFNFSTTGGTINPGGVYTAPLMAEIDTIKAAVGNISGTTMVTVINPFPIVLTVATASPSVVTGTTTNLSILADDDGGESNLTYTWSTLNASFAPVTYSINGTNASKNTVATFAKAGFYLIEVAITDTTSRTTKSDVIVEVQATPTVVSVTPGNMDVILGATQQFTVAAADQFSAAINSPNVVWSVAGTGTVDANGLFTAGDSLSGFVVTALVGVVSGSASGNVVPPTYNVTNTNDSGDGSLRAAILTANAGPAIPSVIAFVIPGGGVQNIQLGSALDDLLRLITFTVPTGTSVGIGTVNSFTLREFPQLSVSGGGNLTLGGNQTRLRATSITVNNGSNLTLASDAGTKITLVSNGQTTFTATQHLASLTVGDGGLATVAAGGSRDLFVNALSLSGTGALDLTDHGLVLHADSASVGDEKSQLISMLAGGYGGSLTHWDGSGLRSSTAHTNFSRLTALGLMQNNFGGAPRYTTFSGEAIGINDLLVKYAHYGDANLDGVIDGGDYALTDNGHNLKLSGWENGDFNYNGVVDGGDYALLDNGYYFQGLPVSNGGLKALSLPLALPATTATQTTNTADAALAAYLANAQASANSLLATDAISMNSRRNWLL